MAGGEATHSSARSGRIGEVFTPIAWAKWLLDEFGVVNDFLSGKSVADPTGGEGHFIFALLDLALSRGARLSKATLKRVYLVERRGEYIDTFLRRFAQHYGMPFPAGNVFCRDIVTCPSLFTVDILIGNPPWVNFTDLPPDYKAQIKKHFIAEGLVPDRRQVLLGASRVDLAALILKISLGRYLKTGGRGCFFIPTSLFFGDSAHQGFRDYRANGRPFCVSRVVTFENNSKLFDKAATAFGAAEFRMDRTQAFPIPFHRHSRGTMRRCDGYPLLALTDPLRLVDHALEKPAWLPLPSIPHEKPRQGVNTCGANQVFIFDNLPEHVPKDHLYPLITRECFREDHPIPRKWVLLPYNRETGRVMTMEKLSEFPELVKHLEMFRHELKDRKGVLLGAQIKKGCWWALLGVGPYAFSPYKVAWEAFGKSHFRPRIFTHIDGRPWQGNQAMHAFIPCLSRMEAETTLDTLQSADFQRLLTELNGGGKCNWAQPGKIRKILGFLSSPTTK